MSPAETRGLLADCLTLWGIAAKPAAGPEGWEMDTPEGMFSLAPADPDLRPLRWFVQTPERRAAGRPPRAVPSIVAALSTLRNHLGVATGPGLRVGPQG